MHTPQLLSVNETCRRLGIGRTKFYALLQTGELTGVCRIGRRTLIRSEALSDFVEKQTQAVWGHD